jgi:hypothetical protein
MSFGNAILDFLGQQDPRRQLMGTPPTPQPGGGTPADGGMAPGMAAPGQPPAQPEQPAVYQSPPELMQLYSQLMDRQQKASNINRGIGLIGASLAFPENRPGIMAAFMGDQGNDPKDLMSTMLGFQADQQKMNQMAAQRAAVPAIAAKYGLDVTTAQHLFDTGKLDSVIAEAEKPDRQIITQEDGTFVIVDKGTGQISEPMGPQKERKVELVEQPDGTKIAVWEDTKEPVAGRDPVVQGEGSTADQKNWKRDNEDRVSRGMAERSFTEFMATQRATPSGGGVNQSADGSIFPDPPKDMVYQRDAAGNVLLNEQGAPIAIPIEGGTVDAEAKEVQRAAADRSVNKAVEALIIGDEVDRVLKEIFDSEDNAVFTATGPLAAVTQHIPYGPAYRVKQFAETIRSNVGFAKLQQMRDSSPTGAALGPVSDFENKLLQATAGNLEQAQNQEDVVYNMLRIQKLFKYISFNKVSTPEEAEKMYQQIQSEARAEIASRSSLDAVLKKYGAQ